MRRPTTAGRYALTTLALLLSSLFSRAVQAAPCEFAPVKAEIDLIIDKDGKRGADFKREFKEGTDPIAMLERLVSAEMSQKIDICRFDVAEYLTKRGYPPSH
jgi:hypothetical protein